MKRSMKSSVVAGAAAAMLVGGFGMLGCESKAPAPAPAPDKNKAAETTGGGKPAEKAPTTGDGPKESNK